MSDEGVEVGGINGEVCFSFFSVCVCVCVRGIMRLLTGAA